MPADFHFPSPKTELWVPLHLDPGNTGDYWGDSYMALIGRLRPGATLEQARAELKTMRPLVLAAYAWRMPDNSFANSIHRFAGRSDRRRRAGKAADSARRGELVAADCVRECGEFAAGARDDARERSGGARGAGREPLADSAATDHGKCAALAAGRRVGTGRRGGWAFYSESYAATGHAAACRTSRWMGKYWDSPHCWQF